MAKIWRRIASQNSNIEVLVEKEEKADEGEAGEEELCRVLTYERRRITKKKANPKVIGFKVSFNSHELSLDATGNVKTEKIKYEEPVAYASKLKEYRCPQDVIDRIREYIGQKIQSQSKGQGKLF